MRHCPNPECKYLRRYGRPAEYQDHATTCSDCASALADGSGAAPKTQEETPGRSGPWSRLLVSAGCCAGFVLASFIAIPGTDELVRSLRSSGGLLSLFNIKTPPLTLSIVALGLTPTLSAFAVVELVAALVPHWRHLRLGGFRARRRLLPATLGLAAAFALLQAGGIALYLRNLGAGSGLPDWVPWSALLVLPMGTLLVALLAKAIDRWGLGCGFSWLTLVAVLLEAPTVLLQVLLARQETGLALFLVVTCACCWFVMRGLQRKAPFASREAPPFPIPPSGIGPITSAASLLALLSSARRLIDGGTVDLGRVEPIASLLLVASLGVGFSLLFNQPRRVAALWHGPEASEAKVGEVRRRLAHATIQGTSLLLGLAGVLWIPLFLAILVPDVVFLALATAVALDLRAEWRFRREHSAVPVWPEHRVYAVQPALEALAAAGIPAMAQAVHHRTLLQFFAAYVPIVLLVPADRAAEAGRIVEARLSPSP